MSATYRPVTRRPCTPEGNRYPRELHHHRRGSCPGTAARILCRPRALGLFVDVVCHGVLLVAILIGLAAAGGDLDDAAVRALVLCSVVFCLVVVPVTVETLSRGRSLGKLATGLRVVRDDGGAIRFRHALIRGLTGFLEIYLTLGGLALAVSLFNDKSRRLGDLMAGTYAVRSRVPVPSGPFRSPSRQAAAPGRSRRISAGCRMPPHGARRPSSSARPAGWRRCPGRAWPRPSPPNWPPMWPRPRRRAPARTTTCRRRGRAPQPRTHPADPVAPTQRGRGRAAAAAAFQQLSVSCRTRPRGCSSRRNRHRGRRSHLRC